MDIEKEIKKLEKYDRARSRSRSIEESPKKRAIIRA